MKKQKHVISDDVYLYYNKRVYVPNIGELKPSIFIEVNNCPYAMHQRSTKIHQDLKVHYWWQGMKRVVVEFLSH